MLSVDLAGLLWQNGRPSHTPHQLRCRILCCRSFCHMLCGDAKPSSMLPMMVPIFSKDAAAATVSAPSLAIAPISARQLVSLSKSKRA